MSNVILNISLVRSHKLIATKWLYNYSSLYTKKNASIMYLINNVQKYGNLVYI